MKFLPILLIALLLTACGTSGSQVKKNTTGGDDAKMSVSSNTPTDSKTTASTDTATTTTTTNPAPIERTVDMAGAAYPWGWAGPSNIKNAVDKGKVVFLWSDAPKIEEQIHYFITYTPKKENAVNAKTQEEKKKNAQEKWNDYVQAFIYEMKKENVGHDGYLNQLKIAGNLLAQHKDAEAQSALDKAIQIRTGQ